MRYPEYFSDTDVMEFEYEYNRYIDLQDPGSHVAANAECQAVAEEQRLAELEEYVAMMQQRPYA